MVCSSVTYSVRIAHAYPVKYYEETSLNPKQFNLRKSLIVCVKPFLIEDFFNYPQLPVLIDSWGF